MTKLKEHKEMTRRLAREEKVRKKVQRKHERSNPPAAAFLTPEPQLSVSSRVSRADHRPNNR
jgi:hypothetical protein